MASKLRSRAPTTGWWSFLWPVRWKRTLWAAHRLRKSSLRVESSPMSSMSCLSWGFASGFRAEHGGDVVSGALPVGEEVAGCGVEVDEAGVVRRAARVGEDRRVERPGHAVGGEHVVPGVADPRGCFGDGVEDLLDAVGDTAGFRAPLPGWCGLCGAGEVE